MKRFLPLLLLMLAACSLAACHAGPDTVTTGSSDTQTGSTAASPASSPSAAKASLLDDHFFIGSVSEDSTTDLDFWNAYAADPDTARQIPARYIYINGGFNGGWRTWGAQDGDRAINYIRKSFSMGMIPFFVYYQIPGGGGESAAGDLANIQNPTFMKDYFLDLKFLLDIVKREGNGKEVGIILEPDFLGYMMQNYTLDPSALAAQVAPAYAAGVLTSEDPQFPNTLKGLVEAINYTIAKQAPNALFGWQVNIWASPGVHHGIPNNGLCRITDTMGIAAGRSAVREEAKEVALFYKKAGILSQNAKWVFIDKYGLDGTGNYCSDPDNNPSACIWFWNTDHWNNYVAFVDEIYKELQTPVVMWQIPIGRLNDSLYRNPDTGQTFPVLQHIARRHEDSAATFVFGDAFTAFTTARVDYFGNVSDAGTGKNGSTVTVQPHLDDLIGAGVAGILFGAGTGLSTDFDSDDNWWITKVQEYYKNPKILQSGN
ncbi:MAG: hypothetical protein Q8P84_03380 [Deltaproteobacteria bacterium]|nr:hypothetical protein [Deltaproteobacteria bacterium]